MHQQPRNDGLAVVMVMATEQHTSSPGHPLAEPPMPTEQEETLVYCQPQMEGYEDFKPERMEPGSYSHVQRFHTHC